MSLREAAQLDQECGEASHRSDRGSVELPLRASERQLLRTC
jgi:hypothetical protein